MTEEYDPVLGFIGPAPDLHPSEWADVLELEAADVVRFVHAHCDQRTAVSAATALRSIEHLESTIRAARCAIERTTPNKPRRVIRVGQDNPHD